MAIKIPMNPKKAANGIQSGAVTHHHDQVIVPVNLSTRNTKNSKKSGPVPTLIVADELLGVFLCILFLSLVLIILKLVLVVNVYFHILSEFYR